MGLREAKRYITELRKKQGNPFLWPDFLTGLPDKAAVIEKTTEIYPKLGKYSISYLRIANIDPYLIKYGSDRHAEIIQWAAALLKTTAEKYDCFVGAYDTHDFVSICEKSKARDFLRESSQLFDRKIKTFYSREDLGRESFMSFAREGKKVDIGFMRLVGYTVDEPTGISKDRLLPYMCKLCKEQELP
ncbi:MAG: hypothetical protein Kow0025_00490 [Thermodesulfovibrionales bacterium]